MSAERVAELERDLAHERANMASFRDAFNTVNQELAQARAQASHWKSECDRIREVATKTVTDLNSHYKGLLGSAYKMVTEHPTGACKGCDLKALAERIRELQPPTVA